MHQGDRWHCVSQRQRFSQFDNITSSKWALHVKECPCKKKTNWREFPGWTNDKDNGESGMRKREASGEGSNDRSTKAKGATARQIKQCVEENVGVYEYAEE